MPAPWSLPVLVLSTVVGLPQAPPQAPPSLPDDPTADADDDPEIEFPQEEGPKTIEDRVAQVEDELIDVKQRLEQAEAREARRVAVAFDGFADFGFFVPNGTGVGWIQDFGNDLVPRYEGQFGWVFLGDIFAPAVNSRGEAADLGNAPGVGRFDSVDSGGAPGFLMNEVNFRLGVGLLESLRLDTSVSFVPRTGNEFAIGDFIDVDIAQAEWTPFDAANVSFFAGKFESVFGIEYKRRRADARLGITPSLVARYTTGTQLGLKARARLFDDLLIVAAAVTNGAFTAEPFHFYREIDSNVGKTGTARIASRLPIGEWMRALDGHTLEIGVSGSYGPQDGATDSDGALWFFGVDLEYRAAEFGVRAQWMRGGSPGRPVDRVWGLELNDSGYVEFDWLFLPVLGVIGRVGLRDAVVTLSSERLYLTKSWRATLGLRAVVAHGVVVKAEYLYNGEFGEIPSIANDVFTSSLVLAY